MKCFGREIASGATLELAGGRTLEQVEELIQPVEGAPYVAPGFIDLQVNGFAGVDFCDPANTPEQVGRALQALFATGVTRLLPTVITGGGAEMAGALRALERARAALPFGEAIEGYHVEGPHISPKDGPRGAHPAAQVRPPDMDEFERLQEAAGGRIKLVTLSPEWPEAPRYIEHVTAQGVVASLGHLEATREQIQAAVEAGATLSTHLGNGAHATLPRHPNYLWQQLAEDRLAASFIVDGIHLDASFLTVALRAKGLERAVLVTDAVMPAGCAPGDYRLGEVEVTLHEAGNVTLKGGWRLAGSALRMDRGIENLMKLAGLSLAEAVTLATRNPARVGRIHHRQRGLQPGERADVVVFEFDRAAKRVQVLETYLSGERVYAAC